MRDEYDFSGGIKNPYVRQQKTTVTIRLDTATVDYFKKLSDETSMPYQTLINAYLADCVAHKRRPSITWSEESGAAAQPAHA
ncbi:MAG TPA: BrnA antitoxin family protein [Candidatus Desulfovibrio gallistercoris]|uniref:BrnA antitoxin family protein n=1 Tax=uncultured Desulfovibrio sp. TaxID=167968 RepID=UPI001F97DC99|nr:BrnA antitoxin family protein [uncultured Desulfovibrio sp.]HJA75512.1 BrnA antitoxin family protein [Candidatus Desulfovibrio gallistercoris]